MLINDRLSTFLTQHAGEMAFVQRSQDVKNQDSMINSTENFQICLGFLEHHRQKYR